MPKSRASKDTFNLIKSMNANEKRHFKLYASKSDDKDDHYLRLFEILETQSNFDDEKAFAKLGTPKRSRYARIKSYLYTALLESLEDYYRSSSLEARFFHLMNRVEILGSKRLHNQALKQLAKAEKLAAEKGTGMLLLLTEHRRLNLLRRSEDFKGLEQKLSGYEERKQTYLEKAADHLDLQMITSKVSWLLRYGELGAHQHQDWLEELSKHELMKEVKYTDDLEYTLYFYNLNGLIAGLLGKEAEDYHYRQAYLDAYQHNPEYIRRWPMNYIIALGNVAELAAEQGNFEELLNCTEELRTFVSKHGIRNPSSLEPLIQANSYTLELAAYEQFSSEKKSMLISQLESTYKRFAKKVSPILQLTMEFGIGRYYFDEGNFDRCSTWLNKILQEPDDKLSLTHQAASRLLYGLAQFELGNDRYLDSLIESYRSWMRKRKINSPSIKLIFKVLKSTLYQPRTAAVWVEAQNEILLRLKDPADDWLRKKVELSKWLKAKTQ